ncbi:MAG: hypothetical protein ICV63_09850 [Coleofasciculus sp. Co-bin14]|nr:hypothetical protein [Coleofasciculus sp. Co-bin14]
MRQVRPLTPKQTVLIPVNKEKWKALAFSTEPIDRKKAAEAVKAAYAVIGLSEPRILFFDSPYAALQTNIINQPFTHLKPKLETELLRQSEQLHRDIMMGTLRFKLSGELERELSRPLTIQLYDQLDSELRDYIRLLDPIQPELQASSGCWLDFCFSVLDCPHEPNLWEAFESLLKHCGWVFPLEETCLVCDRPRKLSLDNQQRLHAEGEPAIQFADGYSLYSYHGVTLPEQYGKVHPNRWQAQWLLKQNNAELRRVLIQTIGYSRIARELQATELDSWQEYTLLRIDNADVEPIYLLKMTCPSTEFIHALRVPPNIQSAREAICWVNWGIDPTKFTVQT